MKLLFSTFFFQLSLCFSQTYYGQIINQENDTLNVQILIKGNMIFKNNKILSIQEKITVLNNGVSKDYYPEDLKSFKIRMNNDKITTYDSVDNKFFAERYYSNKVKLYHTLVKIETRQSPYFAIYRVFLVKKPNQEKMIELFPNGFSRLLTQKEMLEKFVDCRNSIDKISKDEIKIKNEEDLVNFIIDYENNCFNN